MAEKMTVDTLEDLQLQFKERMATEKRCMHGKEMHA